MEHSWTLQNEKNRVESLKQKKAECTGLLDLRAWCALLLSMLGLMEDRKYSPLLKTFHADTDVHKLQKAHDFVLGNQRLVPASLAHALTECKRLEKRWNYNCASDTDLLEWAWHLHDLLKSLEMENIQMRVDVILFFGYAMQRKPQLFRPPQVLIDAYDMVVKHPWTTEEDKAKVNELIKSKKLYDLQLYDLVGVRVWASSVLEMLWKIEKQESPILQGLIEFHNDSDMCELQKVMSFVRKNKESLPEEFLPLLEECEALDKKTRAANVCFDFDYLNWALKLDQLLVSMQGKRINSMRPIVTKFLSFADSSELGKRKREEA
jgi:hypothetical protein